MEAPHTCANDLELFNCRLCGFSSSYFIGMKVHLQGCHPHDEQSQNFQRNKLHLSCDQKSTFPIETRKLKDELICDESPFRVSKSWNFGKLDKTPENQKQWYDCGQCKYNTQSRSRIIAHWMTIHDRNTRYLDWKTQQKFTTRLHITNPLYPDEKINWIQCNQCRLKFKDNKALKRHKSIYHAKGSRRKLSSTNKPRKAPALDKWYDCDKCHYRGKTKPLLRSHQKTRHLRSDKIKWYKCDLCDHRSKRRNNLRNHIINMHLPHDQIVWFQCERCDYRAKLNQYLQSHRKICHVMPSSKR